MGIFNNGTSRVSVSKTHGYTIEKVIKAIDFVKHAQSRKTRYEDYVEMYNYLKDRNEVLGTCKPCGAAKYKAAVENYAKYGFLTLVNEGVDPNVLNGIKPYDNGDTERTDLSYNGADETIEEKTDSIEEKTDTMEAQDSVQSDEPIGADADIESTDTDMVQTEDNAVADSKEDSNTDTEDVVYQSKRKRIKKD